MRRLTRREVLKTGGALVGGGLLAGCTNDGRFQRYRVESGASPSDLGATVTAETIRTPNTEHPMAVRITFTCEADEATDYAVRGRDAFPFGVTQSANRSTATPDDEDAKRGAETLFVTHPDGGTRPGGDCWQRSDTAVSEDGETRVTLAPGESVEVERVLLNHQGNELCYPPGEYRFSERYWRGAATAEMPSEQAIEWGFSLSITTGV